MWREIFYPEAVKATYVCIQLCRAVPALPAFIHKVAPEYRKALTFRHYVIIRVRLSIWSIFSVKINNCRERSKQLLKWHLEHSKQSEDTLSNTSPRKFVINPNKVSSELTRRTQSFRKVRRKKCWETG